jgi:hypothetical protein
MVFELMSRNPLRLLFGFAVFSIGKKRKKIISLKNCRETRIQQVCIGEVLYRFLRHKISL